MTFGPSRSTDTLGPILSGLRYIASANSISFSGGVVSPDVGALGGHVARCEDCAHITIAYNSCRNRHCPKCQGAAAKQWLADRETDLLPVPYYHVVFTLPAGIADIALATSRPATAERAQISACLAPLIHQPLHRRKTCWINSIPINQLTRGTQIP